MTATWTTPRTWVTGEVVTAAQLNEQIRDNEDWLKAGAIEKLDSHTVTGSDTATITFTGLSGSYSMLLIHGYARSDHAATPDELLITFNSDTGANYDMVRSWGYSSNNFGSLDEIGVADIHFANIAAANAPSDAFDAFTIEIPAYANTIGEKVCHTRSTLKVLESSNNIYTFFATGYWRSTAAITAITFDLTNGNFVAGSQVVVYGLP